MNVLVVGGGGREHALCWAIARSPLCEAILCAPGNGGIARDAECLALDPMDFDGIVAACRARAIDLTRVPPYGVAPVWGRPHMGAPPYGGYSHVGTRAHGTQARHWNILENIGMSRKILE